MGKKKNSKVPEKKNSEIFDFQDEIVIGINSPKALEEKKKNNSKKSQPQKIQQAKKVNTKKTTKQPPKIKQAQKTSKKSKRIRAILKWTVLIVLLIAAIIYFLMSPLFNVIEITVDGEEKISEEQIISLSSLTIGQNIFKFNKISTIEEIQKNPYIATAEINRNLPNKILITVAERTATFLIELGNAYIYIDNQGYALEISEEKLDLPILTSLSVDIGKFNPGDRLGKDDLKKLEQVISIINVAKSNELYDKIISIDVEDPSDYVLIMEDSKTVHLVDQNNLNVKMLYLQKILQSESGVEGEIYLNINNNKDIFFRETIQEVSVE